MKEGFDIQAKGNTAYIKVVGDISWWKNNSENFTRQIDSLLESGATDIEMYINSGGGSTFEANEIGNQVLRFSGKRKAKLGALAASAATMLGTYFEEREVAQNIAFMIHDPLLMPMIEHESDFESAKKLYTDQRNIALDQYEKVFNYTREEISTKMSATTWMNAKELKANGYATAITGEDDTNYPDNLEEVLNTLGVKMPAQLVMQLTKRKPEINTEMKEIALKLGLAENATKEEILMAMDKSKEQGKGSPASTADDEPAMKALLMAAKAKGLDTELVKLAAGKDFDKALEMVEKNEGKKSEAEDTTRLSDVVKAIKEGKPTDSRDNWSYADFQEKAPKALMEMKEKNFEKFKSLAEAHYKTEINS